MKVQNLYLPLHFPQLYSGQDWSLCWANFGPEPYVWHLWFGLWVMYFPLFYQAGIPDPPAMSADLIRQKARERHFLEQLLDGRKLENYKIPVPIKAELRKYQQVCVTFKDAHPVDILTHEQLLEQFSALVSSPPVWPYFCHIKDWGSLKCGRLAT